MKLVIDIKARNIFTASTKRLLVGKICGNWRDANYCVGTYVYGIKTTDKAVMYSCQKKCRKVKRLAATYVSQYGKKVHKSSVIRQAGWTAHVYMIDLALLQTLGLRAVQGKTNFKLVPIKDNKR